MPDTSAQHLIFRRYKAAYGATIVPCFADLAGRAAGDQIVAALGYRRARHEPLFLEAYLDEPIERVLAGVVGRDCRREEIIEIGNLASDNALAMISLWAQAANDLGGEAEIAVAVLTAPLRSMFRRLGVKLYEIAPADPRRLGERASEWGDYYRLDPVVCAGFIADGQDRLARVISRRSRVA
ncbi:MAG: thermostable hemolysin [Sphingobium sp.]